MLKDDIAMIDKLRGELAMAQKELACASKPTFSNTKVPPDALPFSAGIPPPDVATQHREEVLTEEVQGWKDEVGIYKAWVRQIDEMYKEELKASSHSRGRSQEKSQKKIDDQPPAQKDLYETKFPWTPGAARWTWR